MPGLGRIPERKPQQENYLLSKVMTTVQTIPESEWPVKKNWKSLVNLNQGNTGTCVGHGFAHRMEDAPVRRPKEEVDPYAIYRRACKLDAWPDNDSGDLQFGTSVDAGAQACQAMGLISNFYWAWDMHTAEEFVLNKGSLVIGVTWYEQMFEPVFVQIKPDVYRWIIRPDGRAAGGHCLIVNGRNRELGVWRLKNSWGKDWGQNGQVFMTDEDMNFLLADGGEFCWPQEIKR
jgi:hypothetical protein